MKRLFFGIFILLILSSGGYFYYQYFYEKRPDIWQLVPATAFLSYESTNTGNAWNNLTSRPLWSSAVRIPFFKQAEDEIKYLDSISGKDGSLDKLFRNFSFIASFHVTSTTTFDVAYFLDLNNDQNQKTISRIFNAIEGNLGYSSVNRTFQDITITEVKKQGEDKKFSYLVYENFLVGSFSPLLIEDAVRNINQKYEESFFNKIEQLNHISKLEDDEGNIYIDYSRLAAAIDIFLDKDKTFPFRDLVRMADNAFLDFKITDNELLFNGTSKMPTGHSGYFLSMFEKQNPGPVNIQKILPDNTAFFLHQSISDVEEWKKNAGKYWASTDDKLINNWLDFQTKYEFSFDWFDGEAGLAIQEAINVENAERILILKAKDSEEAFNSIENLALKVEEEAKDSLFFEEYAGQKIIQLEINEWPQLFLGRAYSGFENSYITIFNDYLLIGNSIRSVKKFIKDNEEENVWGKNVRQSLFLENTLGEANFTVMVNMEKAWNYIISYLNQDWKNTFDIYEEQIKSLDRLAFQYSDLDGEYYTSFALGHRESSTPTVNVGRFKNLLTAYTSKDIVTKPYLVKNHNNGKWETIVQDESNILYLISNEGIILWGDSLNGKIVSDIYQIDFYKNKKLQYLFATSDKIHLIDRNGDFVENFPIIFPSNDKIKTLNVIDYDNSKNYRFIASNQTGDLYLFDKNKNNLDGWKPRNISGELAMPGFHIRVKGGDCLLALQKNGILNMMNRRGKMRAGFPFDFKGKITGEAFVNVGNNFDNSEITTITESGELVTINFKGKIVNKEQLYKPNKESSFFLVNDAIEKTFLLVRREYNTLSFLNSTGKLLFEKNIVGSDDLVVQYYYFSSNNQLIIVTDKEQEFTYLFNQTGELLNLEPLESGFPVSTLYYTNDKTYHLYKSFGNSMRLLTAEK